MFRHSYNVPCHIKLIPIVSDAVLFCFTFVYFFSKCLRGSFSDRNVANTDFSGDCIFLLFMDRKTGSYK